VSELADVPSEDRCIDFAWHSDRGNRRSNNEDAARCDELCDNSGEVSTLLVLSDGVGGADAGELASRMAVDGIHEVVESFCHTVETTATVEPARFLADAMIVIDQRIREAGGKSVARAMAATLSAVWALNGAISWGHAGDSRIYLYREGVLTQLSEDHSPVGRLRAEGALTESEARNHPSRNIIDQCLGGVDAVVPMTGSMALQECDILLLCSDGLVDGLWDHELAKWLGAIDRFVDLGALVREMVDAANNASGKDNITAILARVNRVGTSRPL
jgi:PPM family protein phosphatase